MSGDHNMHCSGNQPDLVERLRAMSRAGHDDLSIGDEAADEIERLKQSEKEAWRYATELEQDRKRLEKSLAESQAREAKLRDFIVDYVDLEPNNERMIARYDTCVKPTDDTALKEYKRKVLMDAADNSLECCSPKIRRMAEEV